VKGLAAYRDYVEIEGKIDHYGLGDNSENRRGLNIVAIDCEMVTTE